MSAPRPCHCMELAQYSFQSWIMGTPDAIPGLAHRLWDGGGVEQNAESWSMSFRYGRQSSSQTEINVTVGLPMADTRKLVQTLYPEVFLACGQI